jgi:gamma-glutamylcyclotransferase (GGCT)/AIG2-like uncharacterized protein YtfP
MRRWASRLLVFSGLCILALVAWLWFSLFSPWGYSPPANLPPIAAGTTHQVFVYGTLRQPLVRRLVIGRPTPTRPASLPGFRREGLDLVPQAGASTPGERFVVDAEELSRLDRYERLGVRYERHLETLEGGETAWVYTRLPDQRLPDHER